MSTKEISNLIRSIVEHLVDCPDEIDIHEVDGNQVRILEVKVAREDVGKIIGRQGKTADAIRTIIAAISGKEKKRTILQIVDFNDND
jgi:predicted RNA-binding protein YlqC (UPF0109 family)